MKSQFPTIAQVVLGLPVEGPFDYFIPEEWQGKIQIGMRVNVSFGPNRRVGYVVGLTRASSVKKIKALNQVIDSSPIFGENFLKFAQTFSNHYGCFLGEAIDNALPQLVRSGRVVKIDLKELQVNQFQNYQSTLILSESIQNSWGMLREKIKTQLDQKRGILILVPETIYLLKIKELFQKDFSQTNVAYQENLSAKEHLEQWSQLKEGRAVVAAGVISNAFAPVKNLGLIIVFDEENQLYKHEQTPFYHAREVILMRQKIEMCNVVFVSAAPTAEIWQRAHQEKWEIKNLLQVNPTKIQFVDLTNFKSRSAGYVTLPLKAMLEKILLKNGKVILYLNRRGSSSFTVCQFCGFVFKCPRCSTTLMYSDEQGHLSCRHCSHKEKLPKDCPQCGKKYLKSLGVGVEKIENEMKRLFPQVRVGYVDKTTVQFPQNFNLLIATQAILKWKEKIKADLVAILDMDAEFNRQDFRSSHRAFSLGVHLAALSKEKLIIQTTNLDNYALKALQQNDYDSFYKSELALRKEMNLPPFAHLLAISLRSRSENTVRQFAQELYNHLSQGSFDKIEIHEPQPDVPSKLRDQFRHVIMCRGKHVEEMVALIKVGLKTFKRKGGVVVTINVDP